MATASDRYFEIAIATLQKIRESQAEPLAKAAAKLVETITSGKQIFSFGASHSFMLSEELVYRTGGLMLINPIYPHGMNLSVRPMSMTSQLERVLGLGKVLLQGAPIKSGDTLLLTSVSGRNAVILDMATAAREMGVYTIGITSMDYTNSVTSRHPSGKKLCELVDLVLDDGAPAGDAAVSIEGFSQNVGPLSTVTGCALVDALTCAVVEELVAQGVQPPVYVSANVDGGDEHNAKLMAENADRIHYLG